jgi:hypothetical protein
MQDYKDRTQATAVKRSLTRANPTLAQKFHIVFWDQDDVDAIIMCIHDCPNWPVFVLGESCEVLKGLGNGILDMDWYDVKHRLWIQIKMAYRFEVSTDAYVFLCRRGVTCVDLDDLVGQFSKLVARIHFGMQHEHQMVRDKLKKREQKKVLGEDNSSDIEFVEGGSAAIK